MKAFQRLIFCMCLLVALVTSASLLDSGSVFEDIRIEAADFADLRRQAGRQDLSLESGPFSPTAAPTAETDFPSFMPTASPTEYPSFVPTEVPSFVPTAVPSFTPTETPSFTPSYVPSFTPSRNPSFTPTEVPSFAPTASPTEAPTFAPTASPTFSPTEEPTASPTDAPTEMPSEMPTAVPTYVPSAIPTAEPTYIPTAVPSAVPSETPSAVPTAIPSAMPSAIPTFSPSAAPTVTPVPTDAPSFVPTAAPTFTPAPTEGVSEGVVVTGSTTVSIPASTFNADPTNKLVFGYTIDDTIGIERGTTVVGDAVDARRLLREHARMLQSSSCSVPFTIALASTEAIGAPNAESAFDMISATLTTAISTGTFTTTLNSLASNYSAPSMVGLNVSAPTVTYTAIVEDDDSAPLTDGQIAGIVIGAVVGVAIVGIAVYYYLEYRRLQFGDDFKPESSFYQPHENQEVYRELGSSGLAITESGEKANFTESSLVAHQGEVGRL